jgi:hypothetical protein
VTSILAQYCINVSDIERAIGCNPVAPPRRTDRWPVTIAFARDPDGYLLEFVEYHEGTNSGVPDPKLVGS